MENADAVVKSSGAHSGQTRLLEKRDGFWWDGTRGPFATPRDAYAARLDVCKYCGGFDGHHFIWCYRPRAEPDDDAPLAEPRSDLNATEGPWSGGFADNH